MLRAIRHGSWLLCVLKLELLDSNCWLLSTATTRWLKPNILASIWTYLAIALGQAHPLLWPHPLHFMPLSYMSDEKDFLLKEAEPRGMQPTVPRLLWPSVGINVFFRYAVFHKSLTLNKQLEPRKGAWSFHHGIRQRTAYSFSRLIDSRLCKSSATYWTSDKYR